MKNIIKKYLPDILILSGIWVFTYVKYFPVKGGGLGLGMDLDLGYDYTGHFKFLGIVLLTLGLDIIIRKLIKNNK